MLEGSASGQSLLSVNWINYMVHGRNWLQKRRTTSKDGNRLVLTKLKIAIQFDIIPFEIIKKIDHHCSFYFSLPKPKMANSDLNRLLKSDEIQSALRLPK
jgi:hypothetical protein